MPDGRYSFLSSRSSTVRPGMREKVKHKKGEIFRTSDNSKRIECKNAFRDLLLENDLLNDKLQEKMNYYYSPYSKKSKPTP